MLKAMACPQGVGYSSRNQSHHGVGVRLGARLSRHPAVPEPAPWPAEGGQPPETETLEAEARPPERGLPGLSLHPPWGPAGGPRPPTALAAHPHHRVAGQPLSTCTLRCPPCSVLVFLLAKHFACFLFQNVCDRFCEAGPPGSWKEIGPQWRGTVRPLIGLAPDTSFTE